MAVEGRKTRCTIDSFWDLAYANGDHVQHWESPHPPGELAMAVAMGLIPDDGLVLDLGCGGGLEALYLAARGFSVIGIDTSKKALEVARGRASAAGVQIDFRLADARQIPLPDESVSFIHDRGCFHVMEEEERAVYGEEVTRVLRPGAVLMLVGGSEGCEEEGVVEVSREQLERHFDPQRLQLSRVAPLVLEAPAGALPANLALLKKY